jgi:hypothetical protein
MKPVAEMIEGPEAWDRFQKAMKAIVKVPKSALPPSPFGKRKKTKKPEAPKELTGVFLSALLTGALLFS